MHSFAYFTGLYWILPLPAHEEDFPNYHCADPASVGVDLLPGTLDTKCLGFPQQTDRENFVQAVANAGSIYPGKKFAASATTKDRSSFSRRPAAKWYFRPSVIKRFSRDEIAEVCTQSLNKFNLQHFPFEFNVRVNAISGEQVYSDNFLNITLTRPTALVSCTRLSHPAEAISRTWSAKNCCT